MSEQPWIGPNRQVMRRLELHLTYTCPERCVFCSEEHRMEQFRAFPVTFGRVATVLRQHARRGVTNVHFTGGEPTIHPRFVDVLRLAKKLGMRTSIGTIGTRLADHTFAERAVPFLDEALFSIHGPNAALHNGLARRPWSFERVTTAFRNVLDVNPNFSAYTNTVVTRSNVDALPDTVSFLDQLGSKLIVISISPRRVRVQMSIPSLQSHSRGSQQGFPRFKVVLKMQSCAFSECPCVCWVPVNCCRTTSIGIRG